MREILFRGKRLDNSEWVEGFYAESPSGKTYITETVAGSASPKVVDPATVGQCTGLTDKNGRRIFEGDVIFVDNGKESATFVVKFDKFKPGTFYSAIEKLYGFYPKEEMIGFHGENVNGGGTVLLVQNNHTKILGNIHDNRKLLGGAVVRE